LLPFDWLQMAQKFIFNTILEDRVSSRTGADVLWQ